ncbi:NAD(P)H-hydrate dehydratase [Variovorax sp. J2P1-59]|uniref:NAD(P)H-hydrate dehydratase n=1 Tax=Variovorax flavidus TaxID=3053501 RepID=UPI002575DF18|nr:NAD(P)H-hydrate dehydratase [Variovorax sp. J2P1-59]MDM0078494.1 NAD(P)H-hydrate dehydratase [Variovorax sp. J2P1-59]
MGSAASRPERLTASVLARWPLPELAEDADKEVRGHVLIIAGSEEIPGAALLSAVAALRAGAGKLTIAAPASIAKGLAFAVPEARVIALPEARGGLLVRGRQALASTAASVSALVIGPGMQREGAVVRFVEAVIPMFRHATLVLDALAMSVVRGAALEQPAVLTPHAGEMAYLSGLSKEAVCEDPVGAAREAAALWNACVALKGGSTIIAAAEGGLWQFDGGTNGLATSGSGDTLAGLIGGLAARGLPPVAACAWGVVAHANAGAALSRSHGPLGYLARELPGEFPASLHSLSKGRPSR